MKKIDLGQTVGILANIGVLVGILLLVYELNRNRQMMEAQTRNDLSRNVIELFTSDGSDASIAAILLKGYEDAEMSDVEQFMFNRRMNAWFRYWENVHYQYRNGLYDDTEFSKQMEAIAGSLSSRPGQVEIWCQVRDGYSPQFAADLDDLLTTYTC